MTMTNAHRCLVWVWE